ncbi:MAG: hypothetical protein R3F20_11860 [Planctomycetota bacterium]
MNEKIRSTGPLLVLAAILALALVLLVPAFCERSEAGLEGPEARPEAVTSGPRARRDRGEVPVPAPDRPAPSSVGSAPPPDSDPVEIALDPLDHGPAVARPRARIALEVLDARGQPTSYRDNAVVRLWRLLGPYRLDVPARFDVNQQGLYSRGRGGAGIEPGPHEIALSAGAYGAGELAFSVEPDRPHVGTLRTTGYSRVITLRFVDPEGRPIPALSDLPRFVHPRSDSIPGRWSRPTSVLRDPPVTGGNLGGIGGGSFSHRSSDRRRGSSWLTDEGRLCVRVVAGVGGALEIPEDRALFEPLESKISITSDFTGSEWEDYRIVRRPLPDYAERLAKRRVANANDPGRYALAAPIASRFRVEEWQPRPAAERPPTGDRVRLHVDVPEDFRARYRAKDGRIRVFDAARETGPCHFDLHPGTVVELRAGDGALARTARPEPYVVGSAAEQHVALGEGLVPVEVELVLGPTLGAWARSARLGFAGDRLPPGERNDGEFEERSRILSGTPRARIRTAIDPVTLTRRAEDDRIVVCLTPGEGRGREETLVYEFALDADRRAELRGGFLELDLANAAPRGAAGLLVLRAVGPAGEGLPWVEGSVFELDDEPAAGHAREVSRRLAEEGRRPDDLARHLRAKTGDEVPDDIPLVDDAPFLPSTRSSTDLSTFGATGRARPYLAPESLARRYDEEIVAEYGLAALDRLHRFGAWYDTVRSIDSDDHGYVVCRFPPGDRRGLVAGRRYVLYLWSRSRDDLVPDRRFVFEARAGVTDLGAIALPGY